MHTKNAESGFINRAYPPFRKPQIGKKVYLTRTPLGCGIKIIIELAWEFLDGHSNTVVTRKFKRSGLTEQAIYDVVVEAIDWYPDWHFQQSEGGLLTPHIVWDRGHKGCVYDNHGVKGDRTRRGVISDEHYTRAAALIPYANAVQSLWSSKNKITKEDLEQACPKDKFVGPSRKLKS